MTTYRDLEPCDYFDREDRDWSTCLRTIGWLGIGEEYPRGPILSDVRETLEKLVKDHWAFFVHMDLHFCELCFGAEEPSMDEAQAAIASGRVPGGPMPWGNRNVFVPGRGVIYVTPGMILHYIDIHAYLPPSEFLDAVLACPPMNSRRYFRTLRREASGDFLLEIPRFGGG